jgi:hypothetical protein
MYVILNQAVDNLIFPPKPTDPAYDGSTLFNII